MPLYCDVEKKHHNFSNIIEPQIKTVSILKDISMKIAYLVLFKLNSLRALASCKNYVSIFPSFINGLSEVGFLKEVYQTFGQTRPSPFFQITN